GGRRRTGRVPFGSIAALAAIATTVPVATSATSLRRFARHRRALGWAGQSRLGRFDRRQRVVAGGRLRTRLPRWTRLALRLSFPRFAGRTRFTRGTRLALRLSFARWLLPFARRSFALRLAIARLLAIAALAAGA